ncbi:hypothetical protein ACF0H5_006812 [Mactra antiquata]
MKEIKPTSTIYKQETSELTEMKKLLLKLKKWRQNLTNLKDQQRGLLFSQSAIIVEKKGTQKEHARNCCLQWYALIVSSQVIRKEDSNRSVIRWNLTISF